MVVAFQAMRSGRGSGTATVLFTDLVESTDLMIQVGEAAFDDLRRAHFGALRAAIERFGGEEIKNTGDGVMAVFGSVVDAVHCAVAMQQATARQAHSGSAPLAIRVGLSVGEVTFEDGDVFGAPVVEAARLVSAAAPGQILTTAIARALAGGRVEAGFVELGALKLKGLPEVSACELAWGPRPEASLPMPSLLTDIGPVFVGRGAEVERLSQLWKKVAAGERRIGHPHQLPEVLVLLAGEPGIGKTRLAAELSKSAHAEGAIVLAGRCDEDLGVPYQPFVEALRHFIDYTPAEDLPDRLGRYGGELARLVPELTDVSELQPPLKSDPETERYRLFDSVAAWLAAVAAEVPILLVLDDLQWAAKPTLLLLRHIVRAPDLSGILVLGTYRDTELGHEHPLVEVLADLRRQGGVERISLSGLDSSGVASFVEQAAGYELDDEHRALAQAIYQETEGNPFFVREVLRHLAETGAFEREDGRPGAPLKVEELRIPEGIREVVRRRLARLSDEANDVLRVAAVVGTEFELGVLQAVEKRLDDEHLISALEEATAAHLLIEAPGPAARLRFAHALVRDTIYDGLSVARRVILHRQVAEAIEAVHATAMDEHVPALAHHYGRAADQRKAFQYATRAGDLALTRFANDEAVVYYSQAVDLVEGRKESQLVQLLIALGEAQRRAGDPAYRQTLLDAAALAKNLHDADGLARAALANTRSLIYSTTGEVDYERIAALEAALEMTPEAESATRARLLATLGLELVWDPGIARRVALSDEALSIARRGDDRALLADVLLARYFTIGTPGNLDERLSNTTDLLAAAEHLGDKLTMSRALTLAFRAAMETGNIENAIRCQQANEQLAAELHQPVLHHLAALEKAGLALLAGRLDEAEHHIIAALELGQTAGQPDASLYFVVPLAQVRCEQGRTVEMEGALLDHLARLPRVRTLESILALHYAEQDRRADAIRVFEGLAAGNFDIPLDLTWLRVMTDCAAVCAYLGDTTRALALRGSLLPFSDQVVTIAYGSTVSGSVTYYLALLASILGNLDEAETRFTAAEATHARIGAATWVARTRLEWARMLLARRESADVERARELLDQVLATARELSLANIERRAVTLLQ